MRPLHEGKVAVYVLAALAAGYMLGRGRDSTTIVVQAPQPEARTRVAHSVGLPARWRPTRAFVGPPIHRARRDERARATEILRDERDRVAGLIEAVDEATGTGPFRVPAARQWAGLPTDGDFSADHVARPELTEPDGAASAAAPGTILIAAASTPRSQSAEVSDFADADDTTGGETEGEDLASQPDAMDDDPAAGFVFAPLPVEIPPSRPAAAVIVEAPGAPPPAVPIAGPGPLAVTVLGLLGLARRRLG